MLSVKAQTQAEADREFCVAAKQILSRDLFDLIVSQVHENREARHGHDHSRENGNRGGGRHRCKSLPDSATVLIVLAGASRSP